MGRTNNPDYKEQESYEDYVTREESKWEEEQELKHREQEERKNGTDRHSI